MHRKRFCLPGRISLFQGFRCAWLDHEIAEVDLLVLLEAIKACSCSGIRDLEIGKKIHTEAWAENGENEENIYVSNSLINMYAKCGSLADAKNIFDGMKDRNVVTWNALVLAYALNGEGGLALGAVEQMQKKGFRLNDRTYVAGLKACVSLAESEECKEVDGRFYKVYSLERGMALHLQAVLSGCDSDIFVGNALIDMYSNCGSLLDARLIFDKMSHWDVVSWTSLLMGFAENGEEELALELINASSEVANARTYVAALTACAGLAEREEPTNISGKLVKFESLKKGMKLHSQALKSNYHSDMFVASSLVNLYSECGSLADARMVFDRMRVHDVVSWTSLLLGYVENGEPELALSLFSHHSSELCNSRTFVAVLMACSRLAGEETGYMIDERLVKLESLEKGMALHIQVLKHGYGSEVFVANSLVDMYIKCGSLMDARRVFDKMPAHDVVSWSTLLHGYAENDEETMALELFSRMTSSSCRPAPGAFVSALVACVNLVSKEKLTKLECLETGAAIHSQAAELGFDSDLFLANTLIDLYVKCGSLMNARRVFNEMKHRDSISWNALILGYTENGEDSEALELLRRMMKVCKPTARTFVAAFQAYAGLADKESPKRLSDVNLKPESLERGMRIHKQAAEARLDRSDMFVASALINMYGKCGSLPDARRVFDRLHSHDVVSLTALILACIDNNQSEMSLEIFFAYQELITPNSRTLAAAIMASGSLALLQAGKSFHSEVLRRGLENDPLLINCLVDFYAKSGSMVEAERVFDGTSSKDSVIWSTMVAGFSRQGETRRVLQIVEEMIQSAVEVNGITLLSVLTVCSHSGLVDKGLRCFEEMKMRHGVEAGIEHYHCLIDMLGRVNRLGEALGVIESMPFEPSSITWTTLLGSATKWGDVSVGRIAYESLLKINSSEAASFMLMANLCGRETSTSKGLIDTNL